MKNFLSKILAVCMLLQIVALCSCENNSEAAKFERGLYDAAIADNYVLFPRKGTYNYCDTPMDSAYEIYNTMLGGRDEKPLTTSLVSYYIVDEKLTAENEGMPVFYTLQCRRKMSDDGKTILSYWEIVLYDMATNTGKTIIDGISGTTYELSKYGDTLLFRVDEADEGWNIYAVNTNGKNLRKLDNPEKRRLSIETVYDGKLYFTEGGSKLYRCDLKDFSDREYLFDIISNTINSFVGGGYVYYTKNQHKVEFEEGSVTALDLYRRSLDELENEELVIKNITRGLSFGENFYYYTADNCVLLQNTALSTKPRYDYGWGILYCFNTETHETKEIYNIMGETYLTKYPLDVSDDYILFMFSETGKERCILVHDLKTGEEKELINKVIG